MYTGFIDTVTYTIIVSIMWNPEKFNDNLSQLLTISWLLYLWLNYCYKFKHIIKSGMKNVEEDIKPIHLFEIFRKLLWKSTVSSNIAKLRDFFRNLAENCEIFQNWNNRFFFNFSENREIFQNWKNKSIFFLLKSYIWHSWDWQFFIGLQPGNKQSSINRKPAQKYLNVYHFVSPISRQSITYQLVPH